MENILYIGLLIEKKREQQKQQKQQTKGTKMTDHFQFNTAEWLTIAAGEKLLGIYCCGKYPSLSAALLDPEVETAIRAAWAARDVENNAPNLDAAFTLPVIAVGACIKTGDNCVYDIISYEEYNDILKLRLKKHPVKNCDNSMPEYTLGDKT